MRYICSIDEAMTYPTSDLIFLYTPEIHHVVEVQRSELSFAQKFVTEFTAALHDRAQHLIIRASSE